MGNHGAKSNGLEQAPVTLKDSIDGMLAKVIHSAYRYMLFRYLFSSAANIL